MARMVLANTATAAYRRCYFDCRDATDGITPETGEAGNQPQISTNGGAWTNTGIAVLSAIGNGRYYADLTQAAIATAGDVIETRYKSAATAETPGDTFQVIAFNPNDAAALGLTNLGTLYTARIHLQVDDDDTKDRWVVRWYKNGVRITSGITSPTITVTDATDASVLINDEDMSDVDGNELLLYAEGTNRVTLGTPYEAKVTATIDGATRTDSDETGRDI